MQIDQLRDPFCSDATMAPRRFARSADSAHSSARSGGQGDAGSILQQVLGIVGTDQCDGELAQAGKVALEVDGCQHRFAGFHVTLYPLTITRTPQT